MIFHCLEHESFETPGLIAEWIKDRSHHLIFTRFYEEDHLLPEPESFDALVIMGGPMSIHDEKDFSWLKKEKQLIAAAIRQKKKLLGICLGSQLIAHVLGARVYPNMEKEIGLLPIYWTRDAEQFFTHLSGSSLVFHWHGDTFDLPPGAKHLACSEGCSNQAFLVEGIALGLQFHLEVTPPMVSEMIAAGADDLVAAPYIQPAGTILEQTSGLIACKPLLYGILDHFFSSETPKSPVS